MTICLKQILFHQEQLKSNLKELFSHFGKYVKQYTNIFAEVGELLGNPLSEKGSVFNGDDLNNYTLSGIYGVNAVGGTITNMPSNTLIGVLIVFKSSRNSASGGYPIVQIYVTYTVESMFIRLEFNL